MNMVNKRSFLLDELIKIRATISFVYYSNICF